MEQKILQKTSTFAILAAADQKQVRQRKRDEDSSRDYAQPQHRADEAVSNQPAKPKAQRQFKAKAPIFAQI
jgi:hypothetical protein